MASEKGRNGRLPAPHWATGSPILKMRSLTKMNINLVFFEGNRPFLKISYFQKGVAEADFISPLVTSRLELPRIEYEFQDWLASG
jgi:hypothetical protein